MERNKSHRTGVSTFASRTSPSTDQSLQKNLQNQRNAQASYGEYLLQNLSKDLTAEFGKGFSKRNHEPIRKFYLTYRIAKSPISQSLTWTHYLSLMRIENEEERAFYEIETVEYNWSVRELQRQLDSDLYPRSPK